MNVILVFGKLAKGKAVALIHTQVMTLGIALLVFPLLLAMAFTYLLLFHAAGGASWFMPILMSAMVI